MICQFLILAVLATGSMVSLAGPGKTVTGEITFTEGSVTLDGQPIITGRSFKSSGTITTAATMATINLGRLGRATLSPETTLRLDLSDKGIGGSITAGIATVTSEEGVAVNIKTPDNVITTDPAQRASFTVDVRSGSTIVSAAAGIVRTANGPVAARADDDDDDDNDSMEGLWIYAAIVGVAITYALIKRNRDDDDQNIVISPVR